jgi:4-methyl-5(b-hydroxyethyl)-thiazole monophosphate biosynthesis
MKAIVILTDGFEEVEAVAPIDLLRRAGIEVVVAGLNKLEICGSHKIKIIADEVFDSKRYDDFDALILPGGPGTENLLADNGVLEIVKNFHKNGKLCCAICAAPKVFDKAGILKDREFTCFPSAAKEISSGTCCDDTVVCDGNIITGKAAGTAIDFSFVIIENMLDLKTAQEVIDKIYY